jgi:hypothetical protein
MTGFLTHRGMIMGTDRYTPPKYWPDLAGHQSSKRVTVDTALGLCTEI